MAIRNNTFILKRSNVVNKTPALSGLTLGELALNTADVKLYSLYTGGLTGATEVREIGWNRLSVSGGTLYGNLNVLGSVSATTYYGDGSNLTGINDYYVTGGTYSSGILTLNRQNGSVTVTGLLSADTFVTGFTFSSNTLTILQNQGQPPLTASIATIDISNIFSAVTFNIGTTGSISATTFYGDGSNLTGINDFYVTGGTFSSNTLTLNRQNGSVTITGFTDVDNFVTGGTYSNGILTLNRQNGSVTVTGLLSADTFVTGFTYNNANLLTISQNQGQPPLSVTIDIMSGLTVNGSISATTYYGDGSNLTGIASTDNFVTGGTYSSGTLTLDRQNGSVTITGFTSTGGGGTSITGFTYGSNNLTISQSNGSNYTVNISTMTGLTINGDLTVTNNIDTTNLYTQYLFDKNDNSGTPGQILVSTAAGVEWTDVNFGCNLADTTTFGLEYKLIDTITGFTNGSYIVKSYITAYSGTSKYGFWERTLGVVTTGLTPTVSIITQDFDDYSTGFEPSQVVYTPSTGNTVDIYISGLTTENLYWESYYDIVGKNCRPIINVLPSSNLGSFGLSLSNGSNTITTGQKGYVKIPYPGTITSWTVMTNSIGSITVDVWKDVEANFPPTSADTITNGNYAYLSNQLINSDSVLSGWTTNFLAGDIFAFNVLSATSVTNINLTINVTKT